MESRVNWSGVSLTAENEEEKKLLRAVFDALPPEVKAGGTDEIGIWEFDEAKGSLGVICT